MKKALYTFIFGDYDWIKEPTIVTPGWDYICFSDLPPRTLRTSAWQFRKPAMPMNPDPKKWAIGHMIMAHKVLPEYDLTISVGGQIRVEDNLDDLVAKRFRDTDMMMIRHPERACVYDEAEACKALDKDSPSAIDAQMEMYRSLNVPPSLGLFATGVIGQRHIREAYRRLRLPSMCEDWWTEVQAYTRRDQLALPRALWRHPDVTISELGWDQTFSGAGRSFTLHRHGQR